MSEDMGVNQFFQQFLGARCCFTNKDGSLSVSYESSHPGGCDDSYDVRLTVAMECDQIFVALKNAIEGKDA